MTDYDCDVLIIGAGPSGSVAGAILANRGYAVRILERAVFPRFSIGESLLPHSMDFLAEAGLLDAVHRGDYQYKNGAEFVCDGRRTEFNFGDKSSRGYNYAFEVPRAPFDKQLADEAERMGVRVDYGQEIVAARASSGGETELSARDAQGHHTHLRARFLLDASGFGRVLARLLDLETPSTLPVRHSLFTHLEDNIHPREFDRQKIRITVHPRRCDVWYWLIPFSGGRASLGVVVPDGFLADYGGGPAEQLAEILAEDPGLAKLLRRAKFDTPVQAVTGYSANVKQLCGPGFALLGNAAEFLDPVFSSGVTIALRSASTAAGLLDRQLAGQAVDWPREYEQPVRAGVAVFRTFVDAWYDGRFQKVIFSEHAFARSAGAVRAMVCSVLAGYAWDQQNPFVRESGRRLASLVAFSEL